MGARMSAPPPLAMLAGELGHTLSPTETARVLAILGAHRCSTIGELSSGPRALL